jgi:hypothetical protein
VLKIRSKFEPVLHVHLSWVHGTLCPPGITHPMREVNMLNRIALPRIPNRSWHHFRHRAITIPVHPSPTRRDRVTPVPHSHRPRTSRHRLLPGPAPWVAGPALAFGAHDRRLFSGKVDELPSSRKELFLFLRGHFINVFGLVRKNSHLLSCSYSTPPFLSN